MSSLEWRRSLKEVFRSLRKGEAFLLIGRRSREEVCCTEHLASDRLSKYLVQLFEIGFFALGDFELFEAG